MGVPPQAQGLLEVLNGDAELDAALQTIELTGQSDDPDQPRRLGLGRKNGARPSAGGTPLISGELRLLPVGSVPGHTGMAFAAEKVAPLIEKLRERAEFIIIDSSPLLTLADSLLLAQHSDDVLVVARHGQTQKDKAEAVRARLHVLGIERIGVVLTDSPPPDSGGYYS
jgi:Mrp family chromosome partitioning ATPase